MERRLQDQVALVLGGGAADGGWGNGKASAVLMARDGARVVVADIDLSAAEDTCRFIADEGGQAFALKCDVSSAVQIEEAVRVCSERFGRLDILLNNVGLSGSGNGLFALDESGWDRVFAINLRSVFLATRAVVPHMLTNGYGRIVNISSTSGLRVMGGSYNHAYAASKAGVIHLTRTIALEFAAQGIRCNCVAPGMIDTPHASGAIRRIHGEDEGGRMIARRNAASPTGAQGTAWDVAKAVIYLASEGADYVNGQTIVVDGGYIWSTPTW